MKAKNSSDIHVLLADQDVVLCVSARRALQRIGFAVTLAHDGNDVLDRFAQASFDVVVIGAALPGRNSLQVLREIKQRRRDTPVILLGDPASEVSQDAEREGAFAYLALPAEGFEELISTIDRALLLRESPAPTPPALGAPVGALGTDN
jgi:DNA-binding NtrC family response regulator